MEKSKIIKKINPLFFKGIAHRGLHGESMPENSIAAFNNAIKNNFAIELDVHLSKDSVLFVSHDDDLIRTTGKNGIIEELTSNEIKENYRLCDGTTIPTLEEVLNLLDERVPLIIELKVLNKNYKSLTLATLKLLHTHIKDPSNIMLISFDPRCFLYARKDIYFTQLLICIDEKWTYKLKFLADGIDVEYPLLDLKKVQKYREKHLVNAWTFNTFDILENYKDKTDMFTFEKLNIEKVR